jgi:hypothetical protein
MKHFEYYLFKKKMNNVTYKLNVDWHSYLQIVLCHCIMYVYVTVLGMFVTVLCMFMSLYYVCLCHCIMYVYVTVLCMLVKAQFLLIYGYFPVFCEIVQLSRIYPYLSPFIPSVQYCEK